MKFVVIAALLATITLAASAQQAAGPSTAATHVEAAKAAAGELWSGLVATLCPPSPRLVPPPPNPSRSMWYRDPARIADNLYIFPINGMGNPIGGVAAYAVETSAGIILLDANYSYATRDLLDAGMRSFGLNPADVKHIVISHGHGDHFGGAQYFQELYGSRVHSGDWDLMTPARAADAGALGQPFPIKDLSVTDGQKLTLGDTTITMYRTPGHTPGTLSFLIPMKINGMPHVAAFWGGTAIGGGTGIDAVKTYVASAKRFEGLAIQANADILLSNHEVYGDYVNKIDILKANPHGPNPFLVGTDGVRRWLQALQHCAEAIGATAATSAR